MKKDNLMDKCRMVSNLENFGNQKNDIIFNDCRDSVGYVLKSIIHFRDVLKLQQEFLKFIDIDDNYDIGDYHIETFYYIPYVDFDKLFTFMIEDEYFEDMFDNVSLSDNAIKRLKTLLER